MPDILTDFSPAALTTALETSIMDYVKLFKVLDRADLYDGADMLRLRTLDVPNPFFNSVLRARFSPDEIERKLDETLAYYGEYLLPIMWWVGSSTQPASLGSHLRRRGFTLEQFPGMAADLQRLPDSVPVPADFRVERVRDAAGLRTWIAMNTAPYDFLDYVNTAFFDCYSRHGFGEEVPLRSYIGYRGHQPVACSSLFMGAGVAGIYSVATLYEHRRQGIGAAMTLLPLLEARAIGYRIGVLSATDDGIGVYQRLGFQTYTTTNMYVYY